MRAEVVLHGLVGRRGWNFHEGARKGKRWEAIVSSTTGRPVKPCSTEPTRLVKSATAALVRREENGYF